MMGSHTWVGDIVKQDFCPSCRNGAHGCRTKNCKCPNIECHTSRFLNLPVNLKRDVSPILKVDIKELHDVEVVIERRKPAKGAGGAEPAQEEGRAVAQANLASKEVRPKSEGIADG